MNLDQPLEFGIRVDGVNYQPRPGSYAVIFSDDDRVAVMRSSQGDFLPGGGAEPGESLEATLRREILEECGCEVEIRQFLGFAVEYLATSSGRYLVKQCSFFLANFGRRIAVPVEEDHKLIWLPIAESIVTLTHKCQSWAVEIARTNHSSRITS